MSDEEWFDALTGASSGGSAHKQEAQALRAVIFEAYKDDKELSFSPDDASLQRMLFRLKKEGLMATHKQNWSDRFRAGLAVAASFMVIIGVGVLYQAQIEVQHSSVITRDVGETSVMTRYAENPFKEMKRIKQLIEVQGIDVSVYKSGSAWFIRAEIPVDSPESLFVELGKLGFSRSTKDFNLKIQARH